MWQATLIFHPHKNMFTDLSDLSSSYYVYVLYIVYLLF